MARLYVNNITFIFLFTLLYAIIRLNNKETLSKLVNHFERFIRYA